MGGKSIGDNIAIYRKRNGMTQEELGKNIGVTTQAVSRWECGGTPDVVLLPVLADTLGVTIDTLFGRETGEAINIDEFIYNRISAIPRERQLEYISRILWNAMKGFSGLKDINYLEHSMEKVLSEEGLMWIRSCIITDEGFILGVPAEDFQFWGVFPEPKGGFGPFISSDEEYQRLFEILGRPGYFSVLRYLYQHNENLYIAPTIAKRLSLDLEEAENILRELGDINLLSKGNLEMEDGMVPAYIVHGNGGFVPFLIFARWFVNNNDSWFPRGHTRTLPYLQQEVQKDGK